YVLRDVVRRALAIPSSTSIIITIIIIICETSSRLAGNNDLLGHLSSAAALATTHLSHRALLGLDPILTNPLLHFYITYSVSCYIPPIIITLRALQRFFPHAVLSVLRALPPFSTLLTPLLSSLQHLPTPAVLFCWIETVWIVYYHHIKYKLSQRRTPPPPFKPRSKVVESKVADSAYDSIETNDDHHHSDPTSRHHTPTNDSHNHYHSNNSNINNLSSLKALLHHACESHSTTTDPAVYTSFVTDWFLGTPIHQIGLDDLRQWLAWVGFIKTVQDLTEEESKEVEDVVEHLVQVIESDYTEVIESKDYGECQCGDEDVVKEEEEDKNDSSSGVYSSRPKFHRGFTGAPCIRLDFDALEAKPRPFWYYTGIIAIDALVSLRLLLAGFNHHSTLDPRITYWVYANDESPSDHEEEEDPIVFVHGLGLGVAIYVPFLLHLKSQHPTRKLILLELHHISMKLDSSTPTSAETLHAIRSMFRKEKITRRATFMGHSMGSVICTWVCREAPELMGRLILLDPVTIKLFDSVSQELYTAYNLRRHFFWYENLLFPSDLPLKSPSPTSSVESPYNAIVFLSESDSIVNAPGVYRYLKENHVDVVMWPKYAHAQFKVSPESWKAIVEAV
ncbi:hypothetical protein HDV05_004151, partial [Chytridiales sp. JEL 0842]